MTSQPGVSFPSVHNPLPSVDSLPLNATPLSSATTKVKAIFFPPGLQNLQLAETPFIFRDGGFPVQFLDVPAVVSSRGEFNPLIELIFRTKDMMAFSKQFVSSASDDDDRLAVYSSFPPIAASLPLAEGRNPWNAHILVLRVNSSSHFVDLTEVDLDGVLQSLRRNYRLTAHPRGHNYQDWKSMTISDVYSYVRAFIIGVIAVVLSLPF
ncbi:hypothetical protein NLJ89_g10420 [Agrocybe chaxingu]|uniref:Uncharacterized protein n=1 Tax=Agrocybe chaxingu TaxID=84603 RepID=A0A9W8MQA7_9AGAR|nr:hypothetical protein NLJ89_g10420 [Agrocybe chaxingu]